MFTMNNRKSITGLAVAVLLGLNGSAYAVTQDGSIGPNSTGTVDINLTIPTLIQVSKFDTISLGTGTGAWSGAGPATGSDQICVYNNSGGEYAATFTGDPGFTITNGAATIPYTVKYTDGNAHEVDFTAPGTDTTFTGANQTSLECGGAGNTNGTIAITITEANMAANVADDYSGVLTMYVVPI